MTEDFLHHLWKQKAFNGISLFTTTGEPLTIIFPGYHNHDAGPDFKQAIIQIGDIKWAGDVEIHIHSSDWYRHKHQSDEKYKSVALHVVYQHDCDIERQPGELYPTLELEPHISKELYRKYQELLHAQDVIACRDYLPDIHPLHLHAWLSTLAVERLLNKQESLVQMRSECQYDWNEVLYRQLAISFGFKTNANAFELLAKSLPYKIILKHIDSQLQVNALIFGQAGLLQQDCKDDYHQKLKYEFDYLRYKYKLTPIGEHHWNLLRLRPQNFPCVRLSQFAAILFHTPDLFHAFISHPQLKFLCNSLSVSADDYWETHYHFGAETKRHGVLLGKEAIHSLLINTVIPVLFSYRKFSGEEDKLESTINLLEQLPFEDNRITRYFQGTPITQKTALQSQALIEMFKHYCKERNCLDCAIGEKILQMQRFRAAQSED